jgi:hypothetical protein
LANDHCDQRLDDGPCSRRSLSFMVIRDDAKTAMSSFSSQENSNR